MFANLSLSKKLSFFGIFVAMLLIISVFSKMLALNTIEKEFALFSKNGVEGKMLTLEIESHLNYISRCTRDIMLGNTYEKNMEAIGKSLTQIEKNFDALKNTVSGLEGEENKRKTIEAARTSTLAFINDGYAKMQELGKSDRSPETLANMYARYKKDATPLANASREHFGKIVASKDALLKNMTTDFQSKISSLKRDIIIESIVLLVIILGYFFYFAKNLLASIESLKSGLLSFFSFLNREQQTALHVNIRSADEIGQMATVINQNIDHIQSAMTCDEAFVLDVQRFVNEIAAGNMLAKIEKTPCTQTLQSLHGMLTKMQYDLEHTVARNIPMLLDILEHYKRQDFTKRFPSPYAKIAVSINALGEEICAMLRSSKLSSEALRSKAGELEDLMARLQDATNEQASSIEETAAAMEQINGSISTTSERTKDIVSQSEQIKSIINIISDIADQTNLLALNAAIEAARAGEHGRGFAVVADEVRKLAERTQKSLGEINASINLLTQSISEIESVISEQADGILHISQSLSLIDTGTQKNGEVADNIMGIAKEVNAMSEAILKEANTKRFE